MSLFPFYPEDRSVVSLVLSPSCSFTSSSSGTAGDAYVDSRRSSAIRDFRANETNHLDGGFQDILNSVKQASSSSFDCVEEIETYFDLVSGAAEAGRNSQKLSVLRVIPGFSVDYNYLIKRAVVENLLPYSRATNPTANFGFTNYQSLNFFNEASVPTSSVLLYPQVVEFNSSSLRYEGDYIPSEAFTLDFWIKPTGKQTPYSPGVILHTSGVFAVSLISGSSKDPENNPDRFKILLQLSSSADLSPSSINETNLPDMVFVSSEVLELKRWHRVAIRWGGSSVNNGTGSFFIDEEQVGTFVVPSSSIAPGVLGSGLALPNILCVGNFYDGPNTSSNAQSFFFATEPADREGLENLISLSSTESPGVFEFNHPLQAEVHEIRIYNRFLLDSEIENTANNGISSATTGLIFYLPLLFTRESPYRTFGVSGNGGVMVTPFQTVEGATTTPFGVELSFETGGFYPNLENYTREFVTGKYPRLWNLTASIGSGYDTSLQTANEFLYASGTVLKRHRTLIPCDNGQFSPNWDLLLPLSSSLFVNDLGNQDLSTVSLNSLYILSGSNNETDVLTDPSGSFAVPQLLRRLKESSSNHVVFFDVSSLFYGSSINPGSVVLTDLNLTGSDGSSSMVLRDNGRGNIFRSDVSSAPSANSSVGNIFYEEGLILLKHPSLFFFGKDGFTISFEGQETLHVSKFECVAPSQMVTSSSNPNFLPVSSSNLPYETSQEYVYVTSVNIHDENLNVVARTNLSQPFKKRHDDKFLVRVQLDW
jgi:hypothetical protein